MINLLLPSSQQIVIFIWTIHLLFTRTYAPKTNERTLGNSCRYNDECDGDQWCHNKKCDLACHSVQCGTEAKPPHSVCVVTNHEPKCVTPDQLEIVDRTNHRNWHLVNDKSCGHENHMRVLGGRNATLGEFPWMALVLIISEFDSGEKINYCGGSIINDRYVVTAAHCVRKSERDGDNFKVKVRLGENDLKRDPDCESDLSKHVKGLRTPEPVEYDANEIQVHPDFRANQGTGSSVDPWGDLALLRSDKKFDFSDFILPICLEYGDLLRQDYTGELAQIIGWGAWDNIRHNRTRRQSTYTGRLQKAHVFVLDHLTCNLLLVALEIIKPEEPPDQFLCAGNHEILSFIGDSGSPLSVVKAVDGDKARTYLIGVTSYNYNFLTDTGGLTRPTVYIRVAAYLDWILDTIRE
uniref:Easter-4 n=1 Tax=Nilaparvata lugens TaxID=108931 RepID=A0A068F582_NILLU|nr:easter-4 [Nilaparvata lugens]APA33882.1 seminal fluid protein [Nilaparvata lugens]